MLQLIPVVFCRDNPVAAGGDLAEIVRVEYLHVSYPTKQTQLISVCAFPCIKQKKSKNLPACTAAAQADEILLFLWRDSSPQIR